MNINKDIQGRSTVSGTRSHHCFILQSKPTLAMKRLSSDEEGAIAKLYNDDKVTSIWSHEQLHQNLQSENYVACLYHRAWYIEAVIEQFLLDNCDAFVFCVALAIFILYSAAKYFQKHG